MFTLLREKIRGQQTVEIILHHRPGAGELGETRVGRVFIPGVPVGHSVCADSAAGLVRSIEEGRVASARVALASLWNIGNQRLVPRIPLELLLRANSELAFQIGQGQSNCSDRQSQCAGYAVRRIRPCDQIQHEPV